VDEGQDHVAVLVEAGCLLVEAGCQGQGPLLERRTARGVVRAHRRDRARVAAADLGEFHFRERVEAGPAGFVGCLQGEDQGVGHRLGTLLVAGVGIVDGLEVPKRVGTAPDVDGVDEVGVSAVAVANQDPGEAVEDLPGVDVGDAASSDYPLATPCEQLRLALPEVELSG
jgi:hypothetical protein